MAYYRLMNTKVVNDTIANGVKRCGSLTALATEAGVSVSYLSAVRSGRRELSKKVAAALGLRKIEERNVIFYPQPQRSKPR